MILSDHGLKRKMKVNESGSKSHMYVYHQKGHPGLNQKLEIPTPKVIEIKKKKASFCLIQGENLRHEHVLITINAMKIRYDWRLKGPFFIL